MCDNSIDYKCLTCGYEDKLPEQDFHLGVTRTCNNCVSLVDIEAAIKYHQAAHSITGDEQSQKVTIRGTYTTRHVNLRGLKPNKNIKFKS